MLQERKLQKKLCASLNIPSDIAGKKIQAGPLDDILGQVNDLLHQVNDVLGH